MKVFVLKERYIAKSKILMWVKLDAGWIVFDVAGRVTVENFKYNNDYDRWEPSSSMFDDFESAR